MTFDIGDMLSAFAAGTAFSSIAAIIIYDGWYIKRSHRGLIIFMAFLMVINVLMIIL